MSKFEKFTIPLNKIGLKSIDLTAAAGFIDSYTVDPDKPTGEKELILMYDERVRNNYVAERANRLDNSPKLKRKYIKIIQHIPYCVYVFWLNPEINYSDNGILHLTANQKLRILQFWGYTDELVKMFVGDSAIIAEYSHNMPLADYYPEEYQFGLEIQKKEVL